jgi:cell volume regulation protein A
MMYKKSVITFFDGIAWLMQIVMFLALGLLVSPKELLSVSLISVVIGVFMILVARPVSVFACLLPFKKLSRSAGMFVSWVGLRGAVPIIFATYPFVENVPGADKIFNVVFCITIISLIVQGSSIPYVAGILDLVTPAKPHKEFAVEIPEDMAVASELHVTQGLLSNGDKLSDIPLAGHALIMMIKRDDEYFIPKDDTEILPGDKLLIVAEKENTLHDIFANLSIDNYEIYKNQ